MKETKKVLIVDDSSIIRQTIEKYIVEENIEIVGSAENGKVALELFKKASPDIVTLDITMPEMDGLTLLEKMMEINKNVKVMIVTALADKATAIKAIKMGAKSHLTKPFTEAILKDTLNRILV